MMIDEQKKKGSSTVFFIFLFSILQRTQRKTRDWTIGGYKTDNLGLIGKKNVSKVFSLSPSASLYIERSDLVCTGQRTSLYFS
jgi:hypothetical protein